MKRGVIAVLCGVLLVLGQAVANAAVTTVNFVCRPWVKTEDYWDVYWDLTEQIKQRFDREGISIPYPQRDVHMLPATVEATA